jgi:hypothetical protein
MAGGMIDHGVNLLDQNLILTSKSKDRGSRKRPNFG